MTELRHVGRITADLIPIETFKPKEGQVWGADKVEVGNRYSLNSDRGPGSPLTILTKPNNQRPRDLPIDSTWVTVADKDGINKKSLADLGVIPYKTNNSDSVHPSHYMIQLGDRSDVEIESEIRRAKGNSALQSALIAAAAESKDEVRRLVYLKLFAEQLHGAELKLISCDLNIGDILYILNRTYQRPGTKPEKMAINAIVQDAMSSFKGL